MDPKMQKTLDQFQEWLTYDTVTQVLRGAVVLLLGIALARVARSVVTRLARRHLSEQSALFGGRAVYYGILGLTVATVLKEFKVDLSLLLGAAGILTIALGFASQTSVSNVISGLFLVGERAFKLGDVLEVNNRTGEVAAIDMLSIKLRTFDNLLIRIPNETLLKSEIINKSRFPIRRIDLPIGVAYKEDLGRVRTVLLQVAEQHPLSLDEPKPIFQVLSFADSAVQLQFSVWTTQQNYFNLKTEMYIAVKNALDENGIEIPFPHRTLYMGSASAPFPVLLPAAADPPAGDETAASETPQDETAES